MIPTYNGQPIFGSRYSFHIVNRDRAGEEESYFGTDGIGHQDGGGRGLTIRVLGRLDAPTPMMLAAALQIFRSCADGQSRDLLLPWGLTARQAILTTFEPLPPVRHPPGGDYRQEYRAEFLCLTGVLDAL